MTENQTDLINFHQEWIDQMATRISCSTSRKWDDPDDLYAPIPRKAEITEKNAQTLEKALYPIRRKVTSNLNN